MSAVLAQKERVRFLRAFDALAAAKIYIYESSRSANTLRFLAFRPHVIVKHKNNSSTWFL